MTSRILKVVVLNVFLVHLLGCAVHNKEYISTRGLPAPHENPTTTKLVEGKIAEVVFASGETVAFDRYGGTYVKDKGLIRGRTKEGNVVEIDINDVLYVRVDTLSAGKSILATVALIPVIFVGLVVLMIPFSCPYIYSFDGENYVFDAEPLGGSVCRGMERTDYSKLDHLQSVDGKYRLIVRNETDETQYIDETSLIVVDHPPGSRVVPSFDGSMHVVVEPVTPHHAVDEHGTDLEKFLAAPDGIAWQSNLPKDDSYRGQPLRHELIFEFSKPPGASTAKLVVNAGTSLWGSNMIKEMLQLRGEKVDAWYESVRTGGPAVQELIDFNVREELFFLRFYLKEGNDWRFRGWIPAGGPLVTEDRVVNVDLSGITGETVTMRLNPPKGFWALDYFGLEFDDHPAPRVQELTIDTATDRDGAKVAVLLAKKDDRRVVMPSVGDQITLEFEAPPKIDGAQRTVFLKMSGYYEIHIDKTRPEQKTLISEIVSNEGRIVEYSMEEYLSLYSRTLSHN